MKPYDFHKGGNPRIRFFLGMTVAAAAALIVGLAWRQFFAKSRYEAIERRQTERRILKPGPRGNIYDRHGRLLVGNRPHYSAVVYLDDLRPEFRKEYAAIIQAERIRLREQFEGTPEDERPRDPLHPDYNTLQWTARQNVIRRYLERINRITGRDDRLSRTKLIRHFNERLLLPLPLFQDLSADNYARLVEQIPVHSPIKVHTDTARHYPYKVLAAHILGYVQNKDPDKEAFPDDGIKTFAFSKKQGRTGLEKSFDERLTGTTGTELWRVDPLGFQDTRLEAVPSKQGRDLIVSIDIDLQRAAETAIGERTGGAVAIDIKTGEILALASRPTYDPNDLSPFIPHQVFQAIDGTGAWLNRSLQLSYPPGSTFKLLTSIAGMRHGSIDRQTQHDCQGVYRVGRQTFRCHARNGHGSVDLPRAIESSCNVFYYAEGLRMGIDVIHAEARRFGLHRKTDIEVPFETSRIVIPSKTWKRQRIGSGWVPGDTVNTAIGQGFLLVTPLQMATFAASLARGETRTRPTLLALPHTQNLKIDHGGEEIGLTPEQSQLLLQGMRRVVGPAGTGRLVRIDGFPIAGKTGTSDFRAHGKTVNLAWFVGFAPVEDPQIAVAVMIEATEPDQRYHGGSTAGPVAKDIFLEFIERYPERAGFPPKVE